MKGINIFFEDCRRTNIKRTNIKGWTDINRFSIL